MNSLTLPVSVGEAVDKYSILVLKKEQITDNNRLIEVNKELDSLTPVIEKVINKYNYHYRCLYILNKDIWDLTDKVMERNPSYNLMNLYDEIFLKNAARFRVKSKLNTLETSVLKEQKSYSKNQIVLQYQNNVNSNKMVRFLALCYDIVKLQTTDVAVKNLYADDPHIIVENTVTSDSVKIENAPKPIPNLFDKFDWGNTSSTINYICGGKLGDFIHTLYVVMVNHQLSGRKGNVYITGDTKWGGDVFSFDVSQTYKELYPIVMEQSYVNSFSIYTDAKIDINLNNFRRNNNILNRSWLEIMSTSFNIPLIEKPWITIKDINENYRDKVLIHRSVLIHQSTIRHLPNFPEKLFHIIKQNKCLFIGTKEEYDIFPYKEEVPLELLPTLHEKYVAINSCKFFVGNQSSPLAMAYSINKSALGELTVGQFYNKNNYSGFNWINQTDSSLNSMHHILISHAKFNGQFDTDRYIAEYFPENYIGTCLDIGMADAITGNNTYHFEQLGWNCLCVEPNPRYYSMGKLIRKNVENVACGKNNADNIEFEIFTINGDNQGAISSLKVDTRLIQSHKHLINKVEKIPVKVVTLDSLLENHSEIKNIDFISIDTEDTELDVLKGFDINKWKPKLLVIENNFDEPFIGEYLKSFGYVRDRRTGVNDFYILSK